MKQPINSFNGGEVSPLMAGRTDLPGLQRSCRLMRNFCAAPTGGALRRPSMMYCITAAAATDVRLITFRAGAESFMLELSNNLIRVLTTTPTSPVTVVTSFATEWDSDEIARVQVVQSNDVMWFVHPGEPVYELIRGSGGWTFTEVPWGVVSGRVNWPPLRDVNTSSLTVTPGGTLTVGGTATLLASSALFDATHVGSWWQVSHFRDTVSAEILLPVTGVGTALLALTANPVAGEQFSIGSVVYRWVAGIPAAPYELTIGGTPLTSKGTAKDAINGVQAPATIGIGTVAHPDVVATDGGSISTATAATATLTISAQLSVGATCTVDGQVYTFKSVLAAAYDVKIGASMQATLDNLILAMDVTGVAGTNYGVGTAAHPTVNARARVGNVATFYARTAGLAGNSIAVSRNTGSGASENYLLWSAATLSGGTAASTEQVLITAREIGEGGNGIALAESLTNGTWSPTSATAGGTDSGTVVSDTIRFKGAALFTTTGRWQGNVYVDRLNAAGTWDVVTQYTGRLDTNKSDEITADEAGDYRIRLVDVAAEASSDIDQPRFLLEARETVTNGLVKIATVTNSTNASGVVHSEIHSTDATPNWREGAFSDYRGYPAAIALHEERLLFAGNTSEPQKVWGSCAGDFRNFEERGLADSSWQWPYSSQQAQSIRWMVSARGLIIGTDISERTWDSGDNGITPLHPPLQRQITYHGSAAMAPEPVGDIVIFAGRSGAALHEYSYEDASGSYIAPDLAQLVGHFTTSGGGFVQIAVRRIPWTEIWAVNGDFELLSCTYSRRDEVVAWAKHPVTDGNVLSVAVVPAASQGARDEIWVVVLRNGYGTYIERMTSNDDEILTGTDAIYHLDCAVGGNTSLGTLSGLAHLAGKTVKVVNYSSGVGVLQVADQVVTGGGTVFVSGAQKLAAGLLCEPAYLQPEIFDFVTESGTSLGKRFNCTKAHLRLIMTRECQHANRPGGTYYDVVFRDATTAQIDDDPVFTGLKTISVQGVMDSGINLTLRAAGIHSLNVLNIIPEFTLYGR